MREYCIKLERRQLLANVLPRRTSGGLIAKRTRPLYQKLDAFVEQVVWRLSSSVKIDLKSVKTLEEGVIKLGNWLMKESEKSVNKPGSGLRK
ncbi:hypothetical protein CYMTET_14345 [Cymbomonas tetramitiformis]|uniref:Uncharacterized protein n=1 Tax=Cymbomonas tetramitiformis TaxID=36881 RepID=A0AAE0GGI6_9CHLO|nr:hypothetical protein CYMTET_14345 [Cymbomonas tetramitiformis]